MEQQAQILRSVLVQLERQEAEGDGEPNAVALEFARLRNQSMKYRTDKTYPTKTAEKQENIKKNRYKDIVPFDHSRVKLAVTTAANDTDYINANFIKGVSGSRAYIATQGPLPHTVLDFLRMLWEYDVKVVVMACREFEMGKKKCECYWPQKQEQPFVCEPFTVYCDSEETKGDYLTRILRLTYCDCSRTLRQLHYVNWPDHGVPDSVPPILEMLDEMRSYQANDDIPICIHCSAGCGRTGVLCVIDYTWNLLKKQMISPDFNIFELVQNMRTQRPSVVQTKEQYALVYKTIKLLFQRYLQFADERARGDEATVVPSAPPPEPEHDPLSPDEELDLQPWFQHLLDEERVASPECHRAPPATSGDLGARGKQINQQQWHLPRGFAGGLVSGQDAREGPGNSLELPRASQTAPAVDESAQGGQGVPTLKPPPTPPVVEVICLMVEDPYFNTPVSSPTSPETSAAPAESTEQWPSCLVFATPSLFLNDQDPDATSPVPDTVEAFTDEEKPPPLPERTPESYLLALDTENSDPCDRFSLIIPPNDAGRAIGEMGGSPSSPVPPLPERTPESFELDMDQAPAEQNPELPPAPHLSRIGTSSEWCGDLRAAADKSKNEARPWIRSKSLKAQLIISVPGTHFDPAQNHRPVRPPLDPPTQPPPPPSPSLSSAEDDPTPPLPDRTPESFLLKETEAVAGGTCIQPRPVEMDWPPPGVGTSGLPEVGMSRSRSVQAKSSTQEPLTAAEQLAQPPVVAAGAGSAPGAQRSVNRRPSLKETSGSREDKGGEKGMSRTKSLKFFRCKQKTKAGPQPAPDQPGTPPPLYRASSSVFKFGFGNRFGKPKGPRSYPETWI